jgi:hypothetical protein
MLSFCTNVQQIALPPWYAFKSMRPEGGLETFAGCVISTEPDERHSLMQASAREKSVEHLY